MRGRRFLRTGLATGLSIGLAGCNTNTDDQPDSAARTSPTQGSDEQTPQGTATQEEEGTEEQLTEEAPTTSNRYFFKDETGALGHLADDDIPDDSTHVITNETTDAEFREMQRNDRQYPEGMEQGQLTMSVDEIIPYHAGRISPLLELAGISSVDRRPTYRLLSTELMGSQQIRFVHPGITKHRSRPVRFSSRFVTN